MYEKLQHKPYTFTLNVKEAFAIHTCKNKRTRFPFFKKIFHISLRKVKLECKMAHSEKKLNYNLFLLCKESNFFEFRRTGTLVK